MMICYKCFLVDSDTFYASFNSRSAATNETNPFNLCSDGEISCVASNQCIPSEKWCDNVVDCKCSNAFDELLDLVWC